MDIDSESDDDTETQIKDLKELTAVLEADEPSSSAASRSWSTVSARNSTSKVGEYSKIETALALNKLTDDKLNRLEKILVGRLQQCRKKLSEFTLPETDCDKVERQVIFSYRVCGKPYFRDKSGFQPPDNEDTIIMKKSGMFDFSAICTVPGWTIKDKSEFLAMLLKMSRDIRTKELDSTIAQLKRDAKTNQISYNREIIALKKEKVRIGKRDLKQLALPIDEDYDWDAVSCLLNRRHNADEYRSLWRLFLHPSINKEPWSKSEHSNLQKIALKYNLQDWNSIAHELNTNRTAYQCFVYFRTNMSNTFTNQKWSKEEVEYLKRLIEYYKEDDYIPWGRVAASMENRTKIQIYNKYMRLTELRKGRFLREEDSVILNCVEKYGQDFKKIKNFIVGRSVSQLRNRYHALNKPRISTIWTVAEDKKLVQLMSNQDSVTNYSSICKHLPGKDRIHIRTRYLTLMRWMQRNPNVDIAKAPRRGARRLCHGQAAANLNKAIERLKNRMQSELEVKKSKRIVRESKEEDIDDAILAFLVTENVKESEKPTVEYEDSVMSHENLLISAGSWNVTNMQKVLLMLKAKLDKDSFRRSIFHGTYPELIIPEQEVGLVKVKSYSKKNIVNTIIVDKPPDIWGNKILNLAEYVLPPHFATITGCKALIAHVSSREVSKLDINRLKRKNSLFKEQLYSLMERFNVLFLWPMLLSNEVPKNNKLNTKQPFVVTRPMISVVDTSNRRRIKRCLSSDDESDINYSEKSDNKK